MIPKLTYQTLGIKPSILNFLDGLKKLSEKFLKKIFEKRGHLNN